MAKFSIGIEIPTTIICKNLRKMMKKRSIAKVDKKIIRYTIYYSVCDIIDKDIIYIYILRI